MGATLKRVIGPITQKKLKGKALVNAMKGVNEALKKVKK